jgi:predicted nucleotidyltransferase
MDKQPTSREDVLAFLADRRDRLRSLGVRRLGLFGSFSRGEGSPANDLDFLAEFEASSFDA